MSLFWRRITIVNLLAALLFLVACSADSPEPTALVVATGTVASEAGAATSTLAPTATPTLASSTAELTAVPDAPTLPPPSTSTPVATQPTQALDGIETLNGLNIWLSNIYQQSPSPDEIAALLAESCWIRDPQTYGRPILAEGAPFQTTDLNGDGRDEWLVAVTTDGNGRIPCPDGNGFGPTGGFLWVIGDGLFVSVGAEPIAQTDTPPLPLSTADLTGDGIADLLTATSGCGAHTCYSTYTFLTVRDGELVHAFDLTGGIAPQVSDASPLLDFDFALDHNPYPLVGIQSPDPRIEDVTGDGVADFVLSGGGVGSVGAGFHRTQTQTWSWDGEGLVLTDFIWNSGDFRHHALYDGNFYFALGQRDAAMTEYLRAIYDDALRDDFAFVDLPNPEASARASARQFAAFRLLLLAAAEDNLERMGAWRDWLSTTYPGTAITVAAGRFVDLTSQGSDLATACTAITTDLENSVDPVGVLDDNLGYANPTLTAADVCPVEHLDGLVMMPPPALLSMYDQAPALNRDLLDTIIDAVESNDLATLVENLEPRDVPCTTDGGIGGLPCAEGEADGTPVPAIQVLGCEGGYVRDPEQYDELAADFLDAATGAYAVYETDGETAIIFGADEPQLGARLLINQGIVSFDFGCGRSPAVLLFSAAPPADVLLVPPAARISLAQRVR